MISRRQFMKISVGTVECAYVGARVYPWALLVPIFRGLPNRTIYYAESL